MSDLHARLRGAIEERLAEARKLLRYSQENALTLADPKWLGREVPGWHEWPAVEATLELSIRLHEAALAVLDMYEAARSEQRIRPSEVAMVGHNKAAYHGAALDHVSAMGRLTELGLVVQVLADSYGVPVESEETSA